MKLSKRVAKQAVDVFMKVLFVFCRCCLLFFPVSASSASSTYPSSSSVEVSAVTWVSASSSSAVSADALVIAAAGTFSAGCFVSPYVFLLNLLLLSSAFSLLLSKSVSYLCLLQFPSLLLLLSIFPLLSLSHDESGGPSVFPVSSVCLSFTCLARIIRWVSVPAVSGVSFGCYHCYLFSLTLPSRALRRLQ